MQTQYPDIHKQTKISHTFEEAVGLTGNGKFQVLVLWTTGIALLGVILEGGNMGLVLPLAKCELSVSNTEQGLINAVTFIGVIFTSNFWGFLADTWGRRKVLLLSLGTGFTFSAISSFSVSSTMLLVTRFFVGLTISGVAAAAISYLSEFHCIKNRSRSLTLAAMFMSLAVVYQGITGLIVMPMDWQIIVFGMVYRPWRAFILLNSMTHAITFVVLIFLPESPKFMLVKGKPQEALDILKIVHRMNKGSQKELFPVEEISIETGGLNMEDFRGPLGMLRFVWQQTRPLLQKPHLGNMLLMCSLNFIMFANTHGLYLWFPQIMSLYYENQELSITTCSAIYMGYNASSFRTPSVHADLLKVTNENVSECHHTGEPMTYYSIVMAGIAMSLAISLVAMVRDQSHKQYIMTAWMLMGFAVAAALYWSLNFYINIVLILMIISVGAAGCVFSTYAGELFPTQFKGMAVCFVVMFGRIGGVMGINFVGAILNVNCEAIFIASAASMAISVPLCYYGLRYNRDTEKM